MEEQLLAGSGTETPCPTADGDPDSCRKLQTTRRAVVAALLFSLCFTSNVIISLLYPVSFGSSCSCPPSTTFLTFSTCVHTCTRATPAVVLHLRWWSASPSAHGASASPAPSAKPLQPTNAPSAPLPWPSSFMPVSVCSGPLERTRLQHVLHRLLVCHLLMVHPNYHTFLHRPCSSVRAHPACPGPTHPMHTRVPCPVQKCIAWPSHLIPAKVQHALHLTPRCAVETLPSFGRDVMLCVGIIALSGFSATFGYAQELSLGNR